MYKKKAMKKKRKYFSEETFCHERKKICKK